MTGLELLACVGIWQWMNAPKENYADEKARAEDKAAVKLAKMKADKAAGRSSTKTGERIFCGLMLGFSILAIMADAFTGWKIFFLVISGFLFLVTLSD